MSKYDQDVLVTRHLPSLTFGGDGGGTPPAPMEMKELVPDIAYRAEGSFILGYGFLPSLTESPQTFVFMKVEFDALNRLEFPQMATKYGFEAPFKTALCPQWLVGYDGYTEDGHMGTQVMCCNTADIALMGLDLSPVDYADLGFKVVGVPWVPSDFSCFD